MHIATSHLAHFDLTIRVTPLAEQMHHSHLVVLRPGQGLLCHVFSLPMLAEASLQALFIVLVQPTAAFP
jgi:hypothetical protein